MSSSLLLSLTLIQAGLVNFPPAYNNFTYSNLCQPFRPQNNSQHPIITQPTQQELQAEKIKTIFKSMCHSELKNKPHFPTCLLTVVEAFSISHWQPGQIRSVLEEHGLYSTIEDDIKKVFDSKLKLSKTLRQLRDLSSGAGLLGGPKFVRKKAGFEMKANKSDDSVEAVEVTVYDSGTRWILRRLVDKKVFDEFKANNTRLFRKNAQRRSVVVKSRRTAMTGELGSGLALDEGLWPRQIHIVCSLAIGLQSMMTWV